MPGPRSRTVPSLARTRAPIAITRHFTETRPLSTYLIAFAAGPWQRTTSVVKGRAISVYIRKSRASEADADTLLALTHRAIGWMEQYFGRPYPFEKFDLMLAPAFPFGGMEHPGVVMFNEDRFIFRERPTLPRRLGRFSTILHEVAHQWFGDLVTMRWFDDLWLKEGFATYMAAKALADLEPASDAWKTFYQSNKPAAYGVDQTTGTTPLWQELSNLDQAKSAYGAIVYNKAPSVLKQLNYLVGEQAFQLGRASVPQRSRLRERYLAGPARRDRNGRQEVARRIRQELHASTRHAGGPAEADGARRQDREARTRAAGRRSRCRAPEPGRCGRSCCWLTATRARNDWRRSRWNCPPITTDVIAARGKPAPAFVFANYQDYGYFVTLLDSSSVRSLSDGELGRVSDGFLRTMLWGALWDQVRDAQLAPERFAGLALAELPREKDEQIVPVLLGPPRAGDPSLRARPRRPRRSPRARSACCGTARATPRNRTASAGRSSTRSSDSLPPMTARTGSSRCSAPTPPRASQCVIRLAGRSSTG